ncbi:T3SS (YopN, CesT) and YbjN peptide-binding chaperone 1 [Aeromonas veronii]|uniref:T3SS (YopN, CesT) and YbjN peptide-binding chaperone 1 n=1 Tax=Aeromonas veronii TaxID=654 RepID=UPI00191D43B1|nr:hypothetical protein [Aeromonas veronii]MBL0440692.1 hypothetical protein [Aeromonas veronii]
MRVSMRNMVMVCLALTFGILLAVPGVSAQGTNKQTPNKAELQQLYMSYLTYEEYKPEIDSDGDVRFKRDGNVYYIDVNERDPEFFRIVLANIWPIESDKERSQVLMAASDANAISKVSKVFTVENDVWVSIDLFVRRPEDFKDVFTRSMSALDNGVRNFVKRMKEQRMKEQ